MTDTRALKFRAWDRINRVWLEVWKISFAIDGSVQAVSTLDETYGMHQVDLVQYTGLKDKKDVEIYEGGVVELEQSSPRGWLYDPETEAHTKEIPPFRGRVYWNKEDARYLLAGLPPDPPNNHCQGHIGAWLLMLKTVVGNIHENPELLKNA